MGCVVLMIYWDMENMYEFGLWFCEGEGDVGGEVEGFVVW